MEIFFSHDWGGLEYIGFYLEKKESHVNSKKLRRAMNFAIDKKKMMEYLRNNIGYPCI